MEDCDLFSQHPNKNREDHWKYEGRTDDMLILDSSHNFHPARYELMIMRNPSIKQAVIVGQGRANLAAIIELAEGAMKKRNGDENSTGDHDTLRQIWSSIEECNALSTTEAMIPKRHVVLAKEGKLLPLNDEGDDQEKCR
jgi:long-subunit acyl-CoA synthetase (AMP-forming)